VKFPRATRLLVENLKSQNVARYKPIIEKMVVIW
jgi:hypothetical protein